MGGVTKPMVCVDCHERIYATIAQAKAHDWQVWVGGARCKACTEKAEIGAAPGIPNVLVCACGHTERWHRNHQCLGYMESQPGGAPRCTCTGFTQGKEAT